MGDLINHKRENYYKLINYIINALTAHLFQFFSEYFDFLFIFVFFCGVLEIKERWCNQRHDENILKPKNNRVALHDF